MNCGLSGKCEDHRRYDFVSIRHTLYAWGKFVIEILADCSILCEVPAHCLPFELRYTTSADPVPAGKEKYSAHSSNAQDSRRCSQQRHPNPRTPHDGRLPFPPVRPRSSQVSRAVRAAHLGETQRPPRFLGKRSSAITHRLCLARHTGRPGEIRWRAFHDLQSENITGIAER